MPMNLTLRDDSNGEVTIIQPILGMDPYVLITIAIGDEDEPDVQIQAGGGLPVDPVEIGSWLSDVAAAMIGAEA